MTVLTWAYFIPIFNIGCQDTPGKGSRYCHIHSGFARQFQDDNIEDTIDKSKTAHNSDELLVAKIRNDKTTRKMYEVMKKHEFSADFSKGINVRESFINYTVLTSTLVPLKKTALTLFHIKTTQCQLTCADAALTLSLIMNTVSLKLIWIFYVVQSFKNVTIVEGVIIRWTKELVKGCTLAQESGGNCSVLEGLYSAFIRCGGIWAEVKWTAIIIDRQKESEWWIRCWSKYC